MLYIDSTRNIVEGRSAFLLPGRSNRDVVHSFYPGHCIGTLCIHSTLYIELGRTAFILPYTLYRDVVRSFYPEHCIGT